MSENSNLTLEQRIDQLQKAKESAQSSEYPKIQRVANHLRDREHITKHYIPKVISFGPVHYGSPKLQRGEHYKQMWASAYITTCTDQTSQILHKVTSNIKTIKDLFDTDLFSNNIHFSNYHNQGFGTMEEMICWTLFVDGCALLHILENAKLEYALIKMNVKIDQLVLVMQDVLLLENQLPYPLLKLLWRNNDEGALVETMKEFLPAHHWEWTIKQDHKVKKEILSPIHHLLHLHRTLILSDSDDPRKEVNLLIPKDDSMQNIYKYATYRNIKELKAAGIGLKSSKTRRPRDISFYYGWFCSELTLPEIVVDDTTANTVLNLIAFEMCPDFENDYGISSYVSFLDSLIDHPDDVKALRSKGILFNSLGSEDEVAKLFNVMGSASDSVPQMGKYVRLSNQMVGWEIDSRYRSKCKTWVGIAYDTYFHTPWAIIAFSAAVLGLTLTFIQTWYAIHPAAKN